uniref:Uncharacterized protein n=1 Tax=Clytia hemisphaerica TaxID=252671 RepID=A0A7M5X8C6_9CNID
MSRRGGERIDYDVEVVHFCCFRCYCYCWRWVFDGPTVRSRSWYACFYKYNILVPMAIYFVVSIVVFFFIKKEEEDTFTKILVVGLIAASLLWWLMNNGPLNPSKWYNQYLPRWIKGIDDQTTGRPNLHSQGAV